MKTTRDELKALVKQCLIEILNEGLMSKSSPVTFQQPLISGVSEQKTKQRAQRFNPALDTPIRSSTPLKESIKREANGNPLMESIFADTAKTTLPAMMSAGDSSQQGSSLVPKISQQEQFHGTPEQIFGEENTSKWANLAFMDSSVKKSA